jgi:hypothetical protein
MYAGFLRASRPLLAKVGSSEAFTNLGEPHLWYPITRRTKRKFIFHAGPTNSGKTFQALQALSKAKSGVYTAPLRLLAWETFEKLKAAGVAVDLITGQEQERSEGARHVSCTIEMAQLDAPVDVAVIDEVQLLADRDRGWAWSRAILGALAEEIHLCGDVSALPVLQRIMRLTGDSLDVRTYNRLGPLTVEDGHVRSLSELRRGDCVIAFGRRALYDHKREIERTTGLRCAVVYGALPPPVRKSQALLFNGSEGGERADVLVATDAIAMGLNLNIQRIIFSKMQKFDGESRRPLTVSETKQIAGRAGRFGSHFPAGFVTGLEKKHLPTLREALSSKTPEVMRAGILPTLEHIEGFAAALAADVLEGADDDDDDDDDDDEDAEDDYDDEDDDDINDDLSDESEADTIKEAAPSKEKRQLSVAEQLAMRDDDDDEEDEQQGDADVDSLLSNSGEVAINANADYYTPTPPASKNVDRVVQSNAQTQYPEDASRRVHRDAIATLAERVVEVIPFSRILTRYAAQAKIEDDTFFLCDCEDIIRVAKCIDDIPLPFRVRYAFVQAPVDVEDGLLAMALRRFADRFQRKGRVQLGLHIPAEPPRTPHELEELESAHAVFDLYLWLARKFPVEFTSVTEARAAAATAQKLITAGLERMGARAVKVARKRMAVQAATRGAMEADAEAFDEGFDRLSKKERRKLLRRLRDDADAADATRDLGLKGSSIEAEEAMDERRQAKRMLRSMRRRGGGDSDKDGDDIVVGRGERRTKADPGRGRDPNEVPLPPLNIRRGDGSAIRSRGRANAIEEDDGGDSARTTHQKRAARRMAEALLFRAETKGVSVDALNADPLWQSLANLHYGAGKSKPGKPKREKDGKRDKHLKQ